MSTRFSAARKAEGISQEELARRSGVSTSTISRFERGFSKDLRTGTLKRLAQALNRNPDEFLDESDPESSAPPSAAA